ncbi:DUF4115 domain-containing protein [Desulfovibrio mangrovi]|uniref:helix-turn-helix domain-containing protein n=1 Tax=Desulfovibrio mangrovi TaxID=2976983 RepID=UPI002245DC3E|nr:helix-turn-helix domain-containing protein [Desulfovibrio mangrovi]UZP68366.1 DUF4115 domain-containing protein [Desulfovibrio mangrovi]
MTSMTELGALLQQERELRGLSREDVSRNIKVAIRTLKALESGDLEELPHLVYTKGFVKSYARLVGLNPDELGAAVDAIYLEAYGEPEDPEPVYTSKNVQPSSSGLIWVLAIVLVLGVVAGGGWYFLFRTPATPAVVAGESLPAESVQPAPAVVEPSAVQQSPSVVDAPAAGEPVSPDVPAENSESVVSQESAAESAPSAVVAPEAVQPEAEPSVAIAVSAGEEAVAVVEPPAEEPAEVPAIEKPIVAAKPEVEPSADAGHVSVVTSGSAMQDVAINKGGGEQKITLSASAECWVEAWGERFERKEMYLRSGQKFVLRFPKTLTLRLGNSGGVALALNGKNVKLDGADGKVLTVNFIQSR